MDPLVNKIAAAVVAFALVRVVLGETSSLPTLITTASECSPLTSSTVSS